MIVITPIFQWETDTQRLNDEARTQIQAVCLRIPCSVFKLLLLLIIVYVWYTVHIRNNIWYRINAQSRNVHYRYHCYEIVSKIIPFTGCIIFCCIIICFTFPVLLGFKNFFFSFIFISWRLITLQYCSGFCHTLTWISHGFTCVPHPDPPSHLPPHPIPLGHPSAPAPSTCLMHPTWAGDLFHTW